MLAQTSMLWFIFLVTNVRFALSAVTFAESSYENPNLNPFCPTSVQCDCAPVDKRVPNKVQVDCRMTHLDSNSIQALFGLRTDYTVELYLTCAPEYQSYLTNTTFGDLPQLTGLHIHGCVFPGIPAGAFSSLPSLQALQIHTYDKQESPLAVHPQAFEGVRELRILNLAHNRLYDLQARQFCGLKKLTLLTLTGCSLTTQDLKSIGYGSPYPTSAAVMDRHTSEGKETVAENQRMTVCLPNLETLQLQDNDLSQLQAPFAESTPRVEILALSGNSIRVSKAAFRNLSFLKKLNISDNQLINLPHLSLPNLTVLDINYNSLETVNWITQGVKALQILQLDWNPIAFGDELASLGNVNTLSLRNCALRSLRSLSLEHLHSLVDLDLNDNKICEIPPHSLANLSKLETFRLSGNGCLLKLYNDSFAGLHSLHYLQLSWNNISQVERGAFAAVQRLGTLELDNNELSEIPAAVQHLGSLRYLYINNNKVEMLQPELFSGLDNVINLFLDNNGITSLPDGVFSHMPRLQQLSITNNIISVIEHKVFTPSEGSCSDLFMLDMSDNRLQSINGMFHPLKSLQYLFLSHNQITTLTQGDLPDQLKVINLSHNWLATVSAQTFNHLPWLQHVDLSGNMLTSLPENALSIHPKLWNSKQTAAEPRSPEVNIGLRPKFSLKGNPFQCDCKMDYLMSTNKYSRFGFVEDRGQIQCTAVLYHKSVTSLSELREKDFLCTYNQLCWKGCTCCEDTERCSCKYQCPDGCTCATDNKQSVHIVQCTGQSTVPDVPSNAKVIKMVNSTLDVLPAGVFDQNGHAKKLFLDNSGISQLNADCFKGLDSLQVLHLEGNHLERLSVNAFSGLHNLRKLYLNNNRLKWIENGTFSLLTRLSILNISGNALRSIPLADLTNKPQTSPLKMYIGSDPHSSTDNAWGLRVPDELHISGNPWDCDCTTGPGLQSWVASNRLVIPDINDVHCTLRQLGDESQRSATQNREDSEWLLDADFSHCENYTMILHDSSSSYTIMASVICGTVCLSVCVGLLIFKFRELIQVWLYARYRIRLHRHTEDPGKLFDAFISYSSKDESFVVHELLPRLEKGSPNFNVCVHFRNWRIGGCISESIIESVEVSRRTILLLSKNFVESEWCSYEFKTAHYHVMREKDNRLIVVLMDNEPPPNLDKDLDLYIKSHTYLQRNDPWFWQKLSYAMPDRRGNQRESHTCREDMPLPSNLLLGY